ncbi:bifunctional [glutamate--ammonia ligase]-adenylyl-L-tyrosine phosphorylase/[glutamate--ammonia-ligase] adenylyltransferase [Methylicorpusculum oleiharenae]|uniref:bifunctional [glutamate--ammonia ligase]-adenylyl-L-tyrosine phosphorylase/[glutamate--ammonia-ligase] adenylyltransferase n=1 Tax=Methylicorpusculum oleiharenae TaxID=1338687 RepID=UPI0013590C6B|nr:bifunctional [glutamate--ammonia ligase]-adenylyl-L-tyrosine phosphorylase/[glutamate--ammonia-ligase] adenylyltransferase [Methylicorpusculum oleiharenae]MCD2449154.1 bifunctional [glutamate--ammonia ligase]-adenylyl-L-tyrosine phosphorylase/[glutamate--ammonia-ligase] adenylyltransferase [Methylicorpusculum oleiharenae]
MLIDHLNPLLISLTSELRESLIGSVQKWEEKTTKVDPSFHYPEKLLASMGQVWLASPFVSESCIRDSDILKDLVITGDLFSAYKEGVYAEKLEGLCIQSEAELMVELRRFRRREMVRIAWRDLAGWAGLVETLTELTWLAESCIQYALNYLYQQAIAISGIPLLVDGSPQQIVVLGMGKLGAWELNFSSDIDLIFAFAEDGVLNDRKQTTYGEFFTKICRKLVKVLDEVTVEGFVFRTDIRLRPFGDSGPIIMTFDGMENYYLTQAREWERYAMIKARQVAGDPKTGPQLMAMLKPFVYRRYIDYGAFEELRSLKYMITQELQRKDRLDNIKLGPGGIREIEFIGQAFQLIRGGQEKSLQKRGILDVLRTLLDLNLIRQDDAEHLIYAYQFLRKVENHIQEYQDKQTHDLPTDRNVQFILARTMGYAEWSAFKADLENVRKAVHEVFDQVFSLSKQDKKNLDADSAWSANKDDMDLVDTLHVLGFQQGEDILNAIKDFKHSAAIRRLTTKGAGVIDRLMPQLMETVQSVNNPDETFKRILTLFEAVAGRNVYLSLLSENPEALAQLVKLSAASPWICDYLSLYPILFDELMDPQRLYDPLKKPDLMRELNRMLADVDHEDTEQVMMKLRQFKHLNELRVAAADIMEIIPIMVVSDYLTYIAEVLLEKSLQISWQELTTKHGLPPETDNEYLGFGILAFGKLGGIELGYGSDLDLVFLYNCNDNQANTNGSKPITCSQFYGRLGQKVMHMLNTRMLSGILYEVDMRLRPSGNSGLLVTPVNTYEDYLRNNAWTWEHQALVRGRFIAGDPKIKTEYEHIRKRILTLPRDTHGLKADVRDMREKMRENLASKNSALFDLKQGKGGIVDIEFIVQFAILNFASKHESLVTYTDNIRLLEGLSDCGYLATADAEELKRVYCKYRDFGHKQALQGKRPESSNIEFIEERATVSRLWHDLME